MKFLNVVGRATLVWSVINSIPTYQFQAFLMPLQVLNKKDSIRKCLLWNHMPYKKRMHHFSWDLVELHHDKGGLSFHNLRMLNLDFFRSNDMEDFRKWNPPSS